MTWNQIVGLYFLSAIGAAGNQATTNLPIPAAEAPRHVSLPPGFQMTLFAGEPDVRQPIAMAFDDRGRLWVAECYTYADAKTNFDLTLRDRILIFEDTAGTGHFDKRKVFWDQGQRLTSIAVGFGGVFATCAPNLIFIPDRDGDGVPDGPPEILLDGWNADVIRHNIVNGLKWGPDGWLYGRHGIQATSSVGHPGATLEQRVELNCSIWRYHPTRKIFEVFCQGGTNPWGHDWDQYGNLFFINTVIGHLWQGIPGAFYKRMYGEHLERFRYGLIDQAADHYHWDTGKSWTDSRDAGAGADALGGGHAHSGLMVYQGDNWPEHYRNKLFTLNFHGRRINEDRLEPFDSGIVGKHEPDFVKFGDPWFRGIDLDYGPDGGVYILDWSDTGECHENDADGVHRETGRIFKLTYGQARTNSPLNLNLARLSDPDLLKLQSSSNEWFARHARRLLQERHEAGAIPDGFATDVLKLYNIQTNIPLKLRLFFVLHAIGGDSREWLMAQLRQPDPYVRSWAVRFLAESGEPWKESLAAFARHAAEDPSPIVRLSLASALQRAPVSLREPVLAALLKHGKDLGDRFLPFMDWYATESVVAQNPSTAVRLVKICQIPLVREYIARRLAEQLDTQPAPVDNLVRLAAQSSTEVQLDILRGLAETLRGWRKASEPASWELLRSQLAGSKDPILISLLREVGVIFRDPWSLAQLKEIATRLKAEPESRQAALRQLIQAQPAGLRNLLETLLHDPATAGVAARGLLLFDEPGIPELVLKQWNILASGDRAALVGELTSRASSAAALLDAMAAGTVPRNALTAFHARQIRNFNQPALTQKLTAVWGEVRSSDADKTQLMAKYRSLLTPERLKQTDLSRGREVFNQTCAVCHKLYGEGAAIGPDLTGSGRANLDYLIENIVDPSAIVPADYKVSEVELKDDRVLSALIVSKNERTLTLQTPTDRLTVDRNDVVNIRQTELSLMPEGLLQGLQNDQIADLIAYLMNPTQVPLPPPK